MSNREEYLATKVISDRFIALDKKNQLTTWDIVTGKLDTWDKPGGGKSDMPKEWNIKKNNNQDYSNFSIYTFAEDHVAYHQDWATRVLLKCNTPVDYTVDENTFYDPSMTSANMKS